MSESTEMRIHDDRLAAQLERYEDDRTRERMTAGPDLYGSDVGERIVDFLAERRDERPFEWAHERQGFAADADRSSTTCNLRGRRWSLRTVSARSSCSRSARASEAASPKETASRAVGGRGGRRRRSPARGRRGR